MTYDFKAAASRMADRRREIVRQKDGKEVEGLTPLNARKEVSVSVRKIKSQEKSE